MLKLVFKKDSDRIFKGYEKMIKSQLKPLVDTIDINSRRWTRETRERYKQFKADHQELIEKFDKLIDIVSQSKSGE